MTRRLSTFIVLAAFFGLALPKARASSLYDYLKDYNVGVNLIGQSQFAKVEFSVDTAEDAIASDVVNCGADETLTLRTCSVILNGGGGSGIGGAYFGGFGVFLQQHFKRTGLFYFDWDVSIGAQLLSGQLESKSKNLYAGLESLEYTLYGLQLKPYIQFGITPRKLPDVLFSAGTVVQALAGNVSVNGEEEFTALLQSSGVSRSIIPWAQAYFEFEIVFLRFGDGAFSWYQSLTAANDSASTGDFYTKDVDAMSDFKASFVSSESGLKLLLNWP